MNTYILQIMSARFDPVQVAALMDSFYNVNVYVSADELRRLVTITHLTARKIRKRFANRRYRHSRPKSTCCSLL